MTFDDFNLDEKIMDGIAAMGFKKPTPVQEKAIPLILENRDIIACAQTGTGKTAAYLLPVLHKIIKQGHRGLNTLIVVPTRELAVQIDQQLQGFTYFLDVSSSPVYGGRDSMAFDDEKKALSESADIVIATPGRLKSHLIMGYVKPTHFQHLILDEADRMLDMGFYEDIMQIISHLPKERETLLFSATMPPKIRQLSEKILNNPETINIAISKIASGILQAAYMVYNNQKLELTSSLISGKKNLPSILIFCSTKINVKAIARQLKKSGFNVEAIHSDLEQKEREEVLRGFRSRKVQILVATDILSRGIDIENISLVINYDVPNDAEDYVHRVGRTARAESTGVALTFINDEDQRKFQEIESLIGKEVPKLALPPGFDDAPIYNPGASQRDYRPKRNGFKKRKFKR